MATKKEILSSEKELQKKKRTYQLTDEGFTRNSSLTLIRRNFVLKGIIMLKS